MENRSYIYIEWYNWQNTRKHTKIFAEWGDYRRIDDCKQVGSHYNTQTQANQSAGLLRV